MHCTTLIALLSSTLALAANIDITVGAAAALRFNPESVTAAVGDTLSFSFFPRNHSVVQSSFNAPCAPLDGGFFSGFVPVKADVGGGLGPQKFVVTVKDTKPIWVYCAQTTGAHCQKGMTMVVNEAPPPTQATLDAFKLAAARTNTSTVPPAVAGGVFVAANGTAGTLPTTPGSGGYAGSGTGSYTGPISGSTTDPNPGSGTGTSNSVNADSGTPGVIPFTGAAAGGAAVSTAVMLVAACAFALLA